MRRYLVKRFLFFIPTLLLVSMLCFFLSSLAPGDAAQQQLGLNAEGQVSDADQLAYLELRERMGLNRPLFYLSFTNAALPDTLYRITDPGAREAIARMCESTGQTEQVLKYHKAILFMKANKPGDVSVAVLDELIHESDLLRSRTQLQLLAKDTGWLGHQAAFLLNQLPTENYRPLLRYCPMIRWYGSKNQYHDWLMHLLKGDLGLSYRDQRPVLALLFESLQRTLILCGTALFLSVLIAVPLGVRSAVGVNTWFDRILTSCLFLLHSIPNFWIASLLIVFLCGGDFLSLFPAFGWTGIDNENGFLDIAWHLVLPVLCLLIATVPYLTRQVRSALLSVLSAEFVQTARAKGLAEQHVIWRHALRNALLPLITVFAGMVPMLVSGAFVIEFLFSIPGIGKLSYDAILARNYPLVYGSVMLVAIFTMCVMLIADLLYAKVDPRISLAKTEEGGGDV